MKRLNASVRGTKQYAKDLFRKQAGERTPTVMRDRRTSRITDVRTDEGHVIYRPKGGNKGIIANVEVIADNHVRVNVHIRP